MSANQGARRRQGVRLVVIVLVAGGLAAFAGAMLGADEPGAAEERDVDIATPTRVGDPRDAPDRERRDGDSRNRAAAPASEEPRIEWRSSQAVGLPHAGNLERGVKLPFGGVNYFTWDRTGARARHGDSVVH